MKHDFPEFNLIYEYDIERISKEIAKLIDTQILKEIRLKCTSKKSTHGTNTRQAG